MKNINRIITVVLVILGVVVALAPHFIFPICSKLRPDGTPMSCYYTAKLVIPLGALLVAVNIFAFLKQKKAIYYLSALVSLVVGFVGYALPNRIIAVGNMKTMGWQIGYCMKEMMQCNHTIKPAFNMIMPLIMVISIVLLITNWLSKHE